MPAVEGIGREAWLACGSMAVATSVASRGAETAASGETKDVASGVAAVAAGCAEETLSRCGMPSRGRLGAAWLHAPIGCIAAVPALGSNRVNVSARPVDTTD